MIADAMQTMHPLSPLLSAIFFFFFFVGGLLIPNSGIFRNSGFPISDFRISGFPISDFESGMAECGMECGK